MAASLPARASERAAYHIRAFGNHRESKELVPLFDWLGAPTVDKSRAFKVLEVVEAAPFDDAIKNRVVDEIRSARIAQALLDRIIARIHKEKYKKMLAAAAPKRSNTRKGDFGEIIAASLLAQDLGFVLPIKKLHFKIRSDDQPTGIDVVGFRVDTNTSTIIEVCYVESKLRTGADKRVAVNAHDQLSKSLTNDLPELNLFLGNCLIARNDALAEAFLEYLDNDDGPESYFIALHSDAATWDQDAIASLEALDKTLEPLTAVIFKVAQLGVVVTSCFDALGVVLDPEDD